MFVDSTSNAQEAKIGIVIMSPKGVKLEHSLRLGFRTSNNEAEYEALLAGLKATQKLEATDVEIYSDSWLVVSQVDGSFEAKNSQMVEYLRLVGQIMSKFQKAKVIQITRGQNRYADSLPTLALSLDSEIPQLIMIEVVREPSIDPQVGVSIVSTFGSSWMDLVIEFLVEDQLLSESKEVERVCRVAARFWLSRDQRLYRRSFKGPYLLCLHPSKVNDLLTELHKGVCGSHVRGPFASLPSNDLGILVAKDIEGHY